MKRSGPLICASSGVGFDFEGSTVEVAVSVAFSFNIPGMGRLLYTSVINNDVPVIQGGILWILTLAVLINTVTDLLYGVLNPAIRVTSHA